jgi:hypothetical protein
VFGDIVDWTPDVQLLAALVEITDALVRVSYAGVTGKRSPARPVRIRRPKPPRPEGEVVDKTEQLRRFFGPTMQYVPDDSGIPDDSGRTESGG